MKRQWSSLISLFLATGAVASVPPATLPTDTMPTRTVAFEAPTGPVTVHSGPAIALPNAADYQVRISDLDRNGDGFLSRAEVPASHALTSEFKLVDRNHDGRISATELQNWR